MKIHRCAHQGDIAGVEQELKRGVSIESIATPADYVNTNLIFDGMTPLQCALASQLAGTDTIEFILDVIERKRSKSKLPRPPGRGKTDLHFAIRSGKIEKIQLLLDLGADINYIDRENGDNFLIDLLSQSKSQTEALALVQLAIARGIKIDSGKRSSLELASVLGWFEIVRRLLDAGGDPAVLGWTDLMRVVGLGTVSQLEMLLAQGIDSADLNVVDAEGRTPWLLSVHLGDVSKAESLLAAGSNPFVVGFAGKLPLMYAIESRNIAMLERSIDIGLDVNAIDECARTPLMLAVDLDLVDAVSMLLSAGANPDFIALEFDDRAIDRVRSFEVLERLLAAGADLCGTQQIKPTLRSLLTKVTPPDEWLLAPQDYHIDKYPRFGRSNPEVMDVPFWQEMVKSGGWAYGARCHYRDTEFDWESRQPVWCSARFGQSMTLLPDGRVVAIAGEHEDYYDPDFCIYNDVVVYDGRGDFQIYGYPKEVFPPTDFHTATWVDGWIYIIGNLGYLKERSVGETPVYRINCTTLEIEPVVTTGDRPGWISKHRAVLRDRHIHITGGRVWTIDLDKPTLTDNPDEYVLDLNRLHWERQVKEKRDIDWQELVNLLRCANASDRDEFACRVEFAPGLTDTEISAIESHLKFRFPPDLRAFIQTALPCGAGFPDWRNPDFASLQEWLEIPLAGILFDVKHNTFWLDEWGTRPELLGDALELVTDLVRSAPPLIPIYNHRMMPAEPHLPGNPVFSVHQTDIIHYGFDLDDYFRNEFHLPNRRCWPTQVRPIRFWDIDRFQTVRWGDDTGVTSMF